MVEVSNNFKILAHEAGRHVYCKIIAGNETFLDDRIIEFDFDDVAHPDWYTIGTTCANRFSFSVRYNNELDVHDEVRPYISFDNEEWCPLGVFYVARRYVRGNYASIVCYDKFYSLDKEYVPTVQAPVTVPNLLKDVCAAAGLLCDDYGRTFGNNFFITEIPLGHTIRDMIGYVAAMNAGIAKIDRYGKLVLKAYHQVDLYVIEKENCIDYSINIDRSIISCIKADNGKEILQAGDGSELSTMEFYNPFITQDRLNGMLVEFAPFWFYGADIVMQGIPYIESGDHVYFFEKNLLPLAVSEVEYHYDGALTATFHSKNRSYIDAAVHQDDLEAALDEIRAQLGNIYQKQTNSDALNLGTAPAAVADFSFDTKVAGTFAQIDVNFTIDASASRTLNIDLYVNEQKISRQAVHISSGNREMLHYYYLADGLHKGKNHIEVRFYLSSGTASIAAGQLIATLVGKGMGGGSSSGINDRISLYDTIKDCKITHTPIKPAISAGFSAETE